MYIAIARPRVLDFAESPVDTTGENRHVRAEVLRLAMIDRGEGGWLASVGVKLDTLVWLVVRRPSGGWAVCGPAQPASAPDAGELYFLVTEEFAHRGEINGASWRPPDASWDALAHLADTLHAAH